MLDDFVSKTISYSLIFNIVCDTKQKQRLATYVVKETMSIPHVAWV